MSRSLKLANTSLPLIGSGSGNIGAPLRVGRHFLETELIDVGWSEHPARLCDNCRALGENARRKSKWPPPLGRQLGLRLCDQSRLACGQESDEEFGLA